MILVTLIDGVLFCRLHRVPLIFLAGASYLSCPACDYPEATDE